MSTVLHNILEFTGLVLNVPSVQAHGINYNGRAVVPDIGMFSAGGFDYDLDETNLTITRTPQAARDNVTVYLHRLHTYERALPPGDLATVLPFFAGANGTSSYGQGAEHLSGDGETDPAIVLDPDVGTSFIANTGPGETTMDFTLGGAATDGQVHHFVNETAGGATTVVRVLVGSSGESAGNAFSSTSNDASFSLVWNELDGHWKVLGTPRAFTIA